MSFRGLILAMLVLVICGLVWLEMQDSHDLETTTEFQASGKRAAAMACLQEEDRLFGTGLKEVRLRERGALYGDDVLIERHGRYRVVVEGERPRVRITIHSEDGLTDQQVRTIKFCSALTHYPPGWMTER